MQKNNLFIFLFLTLFILGTVSALGINKDFKPDEGKYGKVEISDLWGFGGTIIELELTQNTFECNNGGTKCEALTTITLYEEGPLIEDIRFMVETWPGSFSEGEVISYELVYYKDKKWIEYHVGEILPAGEYIFKLEGYKDADKTVDWQIKTNGFWITEWAIWGKQTFLEDDFDDSSIDGSLWIQNSSTTGTPTWSETTQLTVSSSSAAGNWDNYVFLQGNSTQTNRTNLTSLKIGVKIRVDGTRKIGYVSIVDIDNSSNYLSFGIATETGFGSILGYGRPDPNSGNFFAGFNSSSNTGSASTWYDVNVSFINGVGYLNTTLGNISRNQSNLIGKTIRIDVGSVGRSAGGETPATSFNNLIAQYNLGSSITLDSPIANFETINQINTFNCSATHTAQITNMSLFTNQSGSFELVNSTTGLSGLSNSTSFEHNLEGIGNYIWGCQACDSEGECGLSENRTINVIKVSEGAFIYNNITRAGDQEDFSLTLEVGEGFELSSAVFHYNGFNATPAIYSEGTTRILEITDYQIPGFLTDTNVTIYFELLLDDSTEILTSNYTQLVQAIFLDNCTTYTNTLFNISLLDEVAQTSLNGSIDFYYTLLNVPNYETIGSINLSIGNVSNLQVCSAINLTNQDFVQSIEIRYVSDGYTPQLYHIQRAAINPETTNINLYDLNTSQSTEFKITYQDDTFNFVEGAIIQLQRRYISENSYKVVEAPLTSNDGTSVVHVDLDSIKYRITVVKNGELLDTFNDIVFKCQSLFTGECEHKLLGEIDSQNTIDYDTLRDFTYSVTPGTNNISISYSIPSSTPSSINLVLTQKDQWGNETSCNKTVISSGGSIQCTYDDTLDVSYLELNINKDGEPIAFNTYVIDADTGLDFLDNNYLIVVILMLSLVGMAMTSPEWIVINPILVLLLSGMLWLVKGISFVAGMGILMWLLIAAVILIVKLSKQEDR